jgi:acetyl-CoA synthetase
VEEVITVTIPDLDAISDKVLGYRTRYSEPTLSLGAILCDDHPSDAVAFTLARPDGTTVDLTYGRLGERSTRLAAGLASIGIEPGDRVATLMAKSADYLVAVLAIWRLGAVHVPLFTAFAGGAISVRLVSSGAVAVICDADQRGKLEPGDDMPAAPPWAVITAGDSPPPGDHRFADLVATTAPAVPAARLGGDAPMIEIYTSGTTGPPKGVVVPSRALASFHAYLDLGLDLRSDDVYWNAADPGWAYGLYYGVVGPMATGARSILLQSGFAADVAWRVLAELGVTNFAAAPTVYRALRTVTAPTPVRLRCASSAGEPLTPDVNEWAPGALGVQVHDHYGQTEHGMLVNNHHQPALARPLQPG